MESTVARTTMLFALAGGLLAGCAATPDRHDRPELATSRHRSGDAAAVPDRAVHRDTRQTRLLSTLLAQLEAWRGTPYEWGGLDRDGVDCSGFVYRTFRDRFGVTVPRTTRGQARVGTRVPREAIRAGDLVFFRIVPGTRHVGIALGNGRFLHASKQVGVTTSRLDNAYWRPRFWKAVRPDSLNPGPVAADTPLSE